LYWQIAELKNKIDVHLHKIFELSPRPGKAPRVYFFCGIIHILAWVSGKIEFIIKLKCNIDNLSKFFQFGEYFE
jgi:hypothetical protein